MARIMVVGGGPAGLAAALQLAANHQEVILVEKEETLGGSPRIYNCKAVDECRRCGACLVAERVYQVRSNQLIQVMTGCHISAVRRNQSAFQVDLGGASGAARIDVSGIILATGFELFDPGLRGEMGYRRLERVVTARDLEEKLMNAPGDWEEELGIMPRIAIIRCLGSRENSRGVPYCSRVCCLYSEKLGRLLVDRIPGATVDIFMMDGQRYHSVYATGDPGPVTYIRGMPSRVYSSYDQTLIVKYEDSARSEVRQGRYDWVVLCPAVLPAHSSQAVGDMLGIARDKWGFIDSVDGSTNQEGVFAAGCCTGPKTIVESLGSGQTAAELLLTHLSSA
ncbi:MAG: CoB--CoM heterodisulfide reductase iron-sulfur subunit A family protein [Syntrophomonadaceae bacterium]|nr:CoB--CoM heterodisulfide reductase iron-sulfur subunit A family protein [Syntrophomonadaceae bacterium]